MRFTDDEFRTKLARAPTAERDELWRELYDIGVFLALMGASDEAVQVWRFAYSDEVPRPDEIDAGVAGDYPVSAVCYQMGVTDFTHGWPGGYEDLPPDTPLDERVASHDEYTRYVLAQDPWEDEDHH